MPAGTRLTNETRACSDIAGRRPAARWSTPGPGDTPYTAMPERTNEARADECASAPAELAACTSCDDDARPPDLGEHSSNAASCAAVSSRCRFVGDGQVGEHAGEARGRAALDGHSERGCLVGARADTVHPGVDLEVHRMVARPGAASASSCSVL